MSYNDPIPRKLEDVLCQLHRETSAEFDTYSLTLDKAKKSVVDNLLAAQRKVIEAYDLYNAAKGDKTGGGIC